MGQDHSPLSFISNIDFVLFRAPKVKGVERLQIKWSHMIFLISFLFQHLRYEFNALSPRSFEFELYLRAERTQVLACLPPGNQSVEVL